MEGLSVPKMHSDCREAEGDGGSGGGGGDCDENMNDKVDDGTHYNGSKPKTDDYDDDDDDVDDDDDAGSTAAAASPRGDRGATARC